MRLLSRALPILLLLTTAIPVTSCHRLWPVTVDGDGNVSTEERQSGAFNGVDLEGSYDVTLTQAETTSIRIETDKNLLPHIKTEIKHGKLVVSSDWNLNPSGRIKLYISSPNFQSIDIEGLADVHATTPIKSDDLNLNMEGAGSFDLEIHVQHLKTDVAGSGKITLRGDALTHTVDIEGSGDLDAASMPVESAKIDIAGSGDAKVFVAKRLDASIEGSGTIRYKGSVNDVHSSVDGSGKIEKLE